MLTIKEYLNDRANRDGVNKFEWKLPSICLHFKDSSIQIEKRYIIVAIDNLKLSLSVLDSFSAFTGTYN